MKPFPIDWVSPCVYIDPITVTGLAIAGIGLIAGGTAATAMSGSQAAAPAATPTAPPPQAAPQMQPATEKPRPKSNTPSFIGSSAVPGNQSFGSKTLLGQ